MNALQVNFVVQDFAAAIRFYSAMFACPPATLKSGCAEWVLREPSVSFTIFAVAPSRCETASERGWMPPRVKREPQLRSLEAGR